MNDSAGLEETRSFQVFSRNKSHTRKQQRYETVNLTSIAPKQVGLGYTGDFNGRGKGCRRPKPLAGSVRFQLYGFSAGESLGKCVRGTNDT